VNPTGAEVAALRATGIGDLATVVPALRGLRTAFPDRPLALGAPGWLAPLVRLTGMVDRHRPVSGLTEPWPGPPPALAVNLHGRGPESHRLLLAAGSRQLYAFACPAADHLDGPQWIEEEPEAARWCRLLAWYGIPADPEELALPRPPAAGMPTGAAVVHPGAKNARRRWPAHRFAQVSQELVDRGYDVVVTGSPQEAPLARRVAGLAGLPRTAVLAGATGVGEFAAVIAHARLLVSGDTGAGHLATAFGTPSVLLFGPMPPWRWGPPPGRPEHRVLWRPMPGPHRVTAGPDPALLALTPAEVVAEVDGLIADRIATPPALSHPPTR
jgi:ADP-heptose:LPS heptosyltransferase